MERKVKYDYAFKLACVKLVIKEYYSCVSVAPKNGISKSSIEKWVRFYNQYGENGLIPRKKQRYCDDFKFKILTSIQKESLSLRDCCVKFDIPDEAIIEKWKRYFINFGFEGLNKNQGADPLK